MERTVLVLLCLSAAACLVSCQNYPECPEDYWENRSKYDINAYPKESQGLLTRQICTYDLALRFPQYFSGSTGRLVLAYAYFCNDGLVPLRLGPGAYICEVDQGNVEPEPSAEPIVATPAPTEGNEGRPGVTMAPSTERPTTQGTTERPTTAALSECPRDGGYTRNNYTFNSLPLIVLQDCFINTRVNGAKLQKRSQVWVCKPGYKRESFRRGQFRCIQM